MGGTIPREFIKPVEAGIREALENGVLAGYPMVDVKVDAGVRQLPRRRQLRNGVQDRGLDGGERGGAAWRIPILLEPVMEVEVVTPSDFLGDVIGDLSSRRGKIGGMTQRGRCAGGGGRRAAGRDVRLLDHAPQHDPGARGVHDAVRSLRGSAEERSRSRSSRRRRASQELSMSQELSVPTSYSRLPRLQTPRTRGPWPKRSLSGPSRM